MRANPNVRRWAIASAAVTVALGASQAAFAWRAPSPVPVPSRPAAPTAIQGVVSQTPSISADGKFVVFAGAPPAGDPRSATVYLQDRSDGAITELSPMVEGVPSGGTVWPVLSADGCTVTAITEVPFDQFRDDDAGDRWDVYRTVLPRCDGDGDWALVSASGSGFEVAASGDVSPLYPPAVSGEGSVVAYTRRFSTSAPDVLAVEVVDLSIPLGDPGRTQPVLGTPATAPDGTFRHRGVREPSLSSDGTLLAYTSDAVSALALPEWGSGPQPGGFATSHVFVWDRANPDRNTAVRKVSTPAGPENGDSTSPVLSGDGSTIAFVSTASNLVPGATLPACTPTCLAQVYLLELDGGSIRLGSRVPGDPTLAPVGADAAATQPALDHTGDQLLFVTRATNLFAGRSSTVGGPADGDIVRMVPATGAADRVSVLADGATAAPAANSHPRLSATGRVVVFDTLAGSAFGGPALPGRQVATVTATPSLELAALDMGTVAVTFPGPEWELSIINNGPGAFVPAAVVTDATDFLVSGGTCLAQAGVALAPGGTCTVTLMFMPMVEGLQEATLTVAEAGLELDGPEDTVVVAGTDEDGNEPEPFEATSISTTLTGFGGEPTMAPSPAGPHSRPAVVGGRPAPIPLTVYNRAFHPVKVKRITIEGDAADDFEIVDDLCTGEKVDAAGSCQLSVVFTPTAAGRRAAIVKITTDDGAYTTAIVSGDGHYEPKVATSASTTVAGSRVQVTGAGYAPGVTVTVAWADGHGRTATAVTDETGMFTVEFVVLPTDRPGPRQLVASAGTDQVAVADMLVIAPQRRTGPSSANWPGR